MNKQNKVIPKKSIRTLVLRENMAIPSRQLVPGWGRWGPVAGVGSSRRLSGSGCYAGCWPGGSSPASGWSWGTQWWTGGASAGRHGTRRGLSGCWRRGHGDDGRGPCRRDRGFHSHWEGSCGRRSRMSGAGRGCPLSRRRVGWPGLHTWHRRGVDWGPRGLCPRTIAIPAFSRHFRGAARMPGGQWREGCLLGWRRRWWRERRPWCLQRPGGVGWAWPSVQVVGDSYRTWICVRDLLPCRGRSSIVAGCRPDIWKRSRC